MRIESDTLVNVTIGVVPSTVVNKSIESCEGEIIQIGNDIYTSDTTFSRLISAEIGCDTLINYDLRFAPFEKDSRELQLCEDEYELVYGRKIKNDTSFIIDNQGTNSCPLMVEVKVEPKDDCDKSDEESENTGEVHYGITPNSSNQMNRRFVIKDSEGNQIEGGTLRVFNRWKTLVYEMPDYRNNWTGDSNQPNENSAPLDAGTYFFILEYFKSETQKNKQIIGTVTIFRH